VLPLDSLLAVAEDARRGAAEFAAWVVIDARMDQIYAAEYAFAQGRWHGRAAPFLTDAAALSSRWREAPPGVVAGDALGAFGDRLETGAAQRLPEARAGAASLAALAAQAWDEGAAVDPAEALPIYVRDKVAATTIERQAAGAGR
jgi:tRNA threonylcarbamoyladenosine biosynthesis protein TsaB